MYSAHPRRGDVAPAASEAVETAVRRAQDLLRDGAPAREVLALLAGTVEVISHGDTVASVLVLDGEGLLRNGASPSLPADYLAAIDRIKPHPDLGTCAAAAATGEVVFTPDFHEDLKWAELRHLPLAIGFVAAWSMPIKDPQGTVIGTFGTYFREQRLPTREEMEVVAQLAPVAAEAILTSRTAA